MLRPDHSLTGTRCTIRCGFLIALALVASITLVSPSRAATFQSGPFNANLGLTMGVEYTDNVNASATNPKSDISLEAGPYISGGLDLPLAFSGGQRFTLTLSFSYSKSLTGNQEDRFGAPINASLIIPFFVYGWNVVLSDSFHFTNEPLETTFATNTSDAPNYSNLAQALIDRRYGRFGLAFTASRNDQFAPDAPTIEETQYAASISPSYYFRSDYSVFLRGKMGYTLPNDETRRDSIGYEVVAGVSGVLTPSITGSLSAGWASTFLLANSILPDETVDGPTVNMNLSYAKPLRPNTTHSLNVFYTPGVTALLEDSDIQETFGATYSIAHRLNRRLTLAPQVSWTFIRDVAGVSQLPGAPPPEQTHLVSVGIALSRTFSEHLTGSLSYLFQTRMSNQATQEYDVNKVRLTFQYTF